MENSIFFNYRLLRLFIVKYCTPVSQSIKTNRNTTFFASLHRFTMLSKPTNVFLWLTALKLITIPEITEIYRYRFINLLLFY